MLFMEREKHMSTATSLENMIEADESAHLQTARAGCSSPVVVIFTSPQRTLKALEKAGPVAKYLQAGIELLAIQTVPFALPLDRPPVSTEFFAKRLEALVDRLPENIQIAVYVCRDPIETLKRVLNRNSPVVMGVGKRWRLSRDHRLARELGRAGFSMTLVETE
jgi:hypothetical protein